MKAKASEPRGVPFFKSSDKSAPSELVTTDSKETAKPKKGRSGGVRTHDPFTPNDVPEENGVNYSQLKQRVEG